MAHANDLGTQKIKRLIFDLGWPSALNFSVITIYNLTDVFFVGQWLGPMQIAAVVVVGVALYLLSAYGVAIGTGGASIIARALGQMDKTKAAQVVGNQIILGAVLSLVVVAAGMFFENAILDACGAKGSIFPYASSYYRILLMGVPFLSFSMIGNSIIHTQGKAKLAMINSLVPTIINFILNPLFIKVLGMGIEGSALASLIGNILGFAMMAGFFLRGASEIPVRWPFIRYKDELAAEIGQIGGSVLVHIIVTNIGFILLNQILFAYEKETGIVIFGIINRVANLFLIPVIGINGGIIPIVGYNFGSRQWDRVRDTIGMAVAYGAIILYALFAVVFLTADDIVKAFTSDNRVMMMAPFAMKVVFSFFPLIIVHVVTEAYFQAIGKAKTAFYVIILKNVLLLIPLIYILSWAFGYNGILYAFPVADILTTVVAVWLLKNEPALNLTARPMTL